VLRPGRGAHFDPELLDCFGENLDSILAGGAPGTVEVVG
jgi:hypothetical protein